eukprot:scaffold137276_cov25-Prasinocladus_malaysianus.AAC.1
MRISVSPVRALVERPFVIHKSYISLSWGQQICMSVNTQYVESTLGCDRAWHAEGTHNGR